MTPDKRPYVGLGAAAACLIIAGSFLPWAKLVAPFVGEVSKAGTEGDGIVTLVLGLAGLGILAWYYWGPGRGVVRCLLLAAVGGATAIIAAYDIADIENFASEVESDTAFASVRTGEGIYVTLVGGVALALIAAIAPLFPIWVGAETEEDRDEGEPIRSRLPLRKASAEPTSDAPALMTERTEKDRLRRLRQLLDEGLISDADFVAEKAALLSEMRVGAAREIESSAGDIPSNRRVVRSFPRALAVMSLGIVLTGGAIATVVAALAGGSYSNIDYETVRELLQSELEAISD